MKQSESLIFLQNYDFDELERSTEYDGGFEKHSQTIRDFWAVVHDLSDVNKRTLLQFTTGSDRAPMGGLSKLKMVNYSVECFKTNEIKFYFLLWLVSHQLHVANFYTYVV